MPGKDTRVVDMQFQNQQFEKNIATSQKSLSRFKKELNFDDTSKGLSKFGEAIDSLKFDQFFDNIQRLTDKFTGIGRIGEFMISKIRHSLEEAANSALHFANSISFGQIDAGKAKFDSLNKSIQTIKAATGETEEQVTEVLERLNDYTDWTSYSFSDMAQNIGKFTSVGIPLEQAEKQMEGIANWAARSGAGINEASRAMYNLSQAMGVGSLKLMDWKSIENAGMATKEFKEQLIEAGVAAGNLVAEVKKDANGTETIVYKTAKKYGKQVEVNFQNLSQTLSKGWADTTVIGNTLIGYYYDDLEMNSEKKAIEVSEQQKKLLNDIFQQNGKIDTKSWQELVNQGLATDEAKQSLLDTAEAVGALSVEVGEDGKKIYKTFDKTGKAIEFTFDTFEKGLSGNWLTRSIARTTYSFDDLAEEAYSAAQKCLSLSDVFNAWRDMVSSGWMASMQHIFGNLSESMELFTAICNKVQESLEKVFGTSGIINKVLSAWGAANGRESLWGMIIGEYKNSEGKVIYEGAYGLIDIIKDVGHIISEAFWDIIKDFASDVYGESAMANWEEDEEMRIEFLRDKLIIFTDKIKYAMSTLRDFFQTIPEGATKSRWEIIKDVIKAIFSVVSIAAQTIGGIFTFLHKIKNQLQPSITAITDLFTSLLGGITGTEKNLRKKKGIQTFFSNFADALVPVTNIINRIIVAIADFIKEFVKWGVEGGHFVKIWETIKAVFKGIIKIFDKISGPFLDFFKKIGPAIGDFFTKGVNKTTIKNFFVTFGRAISSLIGDFVSYIPGIWSKIKEFFKTIFSGAKNILDSNESGIVNGIIKFIKGVVGGVIDFLKNLGSRISDDNSLFSILMRIIGGGLDILGNLAKKLSEALSGVCLYDLIMGFLGGFAILTALSLVIQVIGIIKAIKDIVGGVGDILYAIADRIRKRDATEKFLNIAKAILMLSIAIVVLGQMPWQEALQGVIAIAAVSSIVIALIWVLGKVVKKLKFRDVVKLSISILAVSASLLVLSAGLFVMIRALKPLIGIGWEGLAKMGAGLTAILLIFAGFAKLTKKIKSSAKTMMAFGILGIGIGIMVNAIRPLAQYDWEKLAKMGAGLGAVLLMLAGFSHIVGSMKDKGIGQAAFLAIGIAILVDALRPLADYNLEGLAKMGGSLLVILLMLAGFSQITGSFKGTSMKSTIALAIGILLLMESIKPLANYDWEKLGKMGAGLGVVLILLAGFAKATGSFKGKSMKSTIALAIGVLLLMESIKPLANYDWEKLGKMGAGLGVVLGMLIVFSKQTSGFKGKSMKSTIALAISVLLLMEAIKPLANYNWEDIGKMSAGLGAVLLMLAMFSKKMASIKGKGIFNLIILAASIYILMDTLKPLADYSWENLGKIGAGLVAVILSLAAFTHMVGDLNFKSVAALIVFALSVHVLISVLKPLADYDWDDLAKLGAGLVACVIMLVIASKAIAKIDWKNALGSFAMMLGMAVMISVFGKTLDRVKDVGSKKMLAFAASIVILSVAIRIVLSSINKLQAQTTGIEIGSKLAMVGAALVTVGILMGEMALLIPKINNADIIKIIGFAAAVDILMPSIILGAVAINKIKAVTTTTEIISKLSMMAVTLISVGLLMGELSLLIPSINNADIIKVIGFAAAVEALMPSMIIAAIAIDKIKALKTSTEIISKVALMITALISVGVLLAELAYFADTISNADVLKIIAFSIAVDALMPALYIAVLSVNKINVPGTANKVISKIALAVTALIAVGVLMGELAYFADTISNSDILKIMGFVVAVDLLMPALGIAVLAFNKLQVPKTGKEVLSKIAMMFTTLIAVGALMYELGSLIPAINDGEILKIGAFVISVDLLMPALWLASLAINNIQTQVTSGNNKKDMSVKAILAKIALMFTSIIAVGVLMGELALLIPNINEADILKLLTFVGVVDLLIPSLITVALAINKIELPSINSKKSIFESKNGKNNKRNTSKSSDVSGSGVLGLIALISIAVVAVGALMLELAWIIPMINKMESGFGGIGKLVGFAAAVDALMPSLIIVAKAISAITVPTALSNKNTSSSKSISNANNKSNQSDKALESDEHLAGIKDLSGLMALIGVAVIAVGALMLELAAIIPLIDKMDFASIPKLLSFVVAVDLLMPSLILVAMAINKIKIPSALSKEDSSIKDSNLSRSSNKNVEKSAKFKDLLGLLALIGIAVLAVSWMMFELSLLIPLIDKMDFETIPKLLGFVIAVDALMPSLILVAMAINKIKIPTAINKSSSSYNKVSSRSDVEKSAGFKDILGLMTLIGLAVVTVGLLMAELAWLLPRIDESMSDLSAIPKLVGFAAAVDAIMPSLIIVAVAINKIKIPKEGDTILKPKELKGKMEMLFAAIAAVALLMGELAGLLPIIDDSMDDMESIPKLIGFALAVDALMPALILVAIAINKIEIPKEGDNILKPDELKGKMKMILAAVVVVAALTAEMAIATLAVDNFMSDLSCIPKLIGFAIAVDALMPAMILAAMAINKIEAPSEKGIERKLKIFKTLAIVVGAAVAELAIVSLITNEMDGFGDIAKLLAFTVAVNIVVYSLMTAVKAINAIKTPTSDQALTKKIDIITRCAYIVGGLMGALALVTILIDSTSSDIMSLVKLVVFAVTVNIIVRAMTTIVNAFNNIAVPKDKDEIKRKIAVLAGALASIVVLMAALALVVPRINEADILKMLGLAVTIYILVMTLAKMINIITDIDVPDDDKELKSKIKIAASALIAIGALIAELALFAGSINNASVERIIAFAGAIYIIVPCISKIMEAIGEIEVPEEDRGKDFAYKLGILMISLVAVGALIAEMVWVAKSINGANTEALVAFSGAIFVIVPLLTNIIEALGEIEVPEEDKLKDLGYKFGILGIALIGVGALIAEMVWVANSINGTNTEALIAFTASIYVIVPLLANIIESLGEIEVPEEDQMKDMGYKLGLLGGALVAVAALIAEMVWVANSINNSDSIKLLAFAASIDIIMVSMLIVVKAINMLEVPDDKNKLWFKIGLLAGALVAIAALIAEMVWVANSISNSDVVKILAFAAAIDIIMVSMLIVTKAINKLETPDNSKKMWNKLGLLAGALIAVAGIAIAFAFAMSIMGDNIDPLTMLTFAASVVIMSAALYVVITALSKNKLPTGNTFMKQLETVILAVIAIGAVMVVFALLLEQTKGIDPVAMLAFSASVVVLAVAMSIITSVMASIKVLGTGQFVKKLENVILAVVAISAIMFVFAKLLENTKDIDPVAMLAFSASVVILSLALVVMIGTISAIKTAGAGNIGKKLAVIIVAIVAIAAVMVIFASMLSKTKGVDSKAMVAFSASILILVVALAAIAAVVTMLGKVDLGTVTKGCVAIAEVATALGVVIDILASFAKSALDKMTTALIDLGTALSWFDDDVEDIDMNRIKDGMGLVYDLCELAIYVMSKGDLSKELDSFSDAMIHLGGGVALFWGQVADISTGNARKTIEDINAMSTQLSSLSTVDDVSNTIANIGGAIKIYSESVKDATLDNVPNSEQIVAMLQAIAQAVPNSDILDTAIQVSSDGYDVKLNDYAIGLTNIATALSVFADKTAALDFGPDGNIAKAVEKLQGMSDLGPTLNETMTTKFDIGGFISFEATISKQKENLTDFAQDVEALGTALKDFGTHVGGIKEEDWTKIDAGIEALGRFAKLQNNLPYVGGFLDVIVGTKDLTTFGKKLPSVGKGLKGFCDNIKGAEQLQNGEAATAADVLIKLANVADTIPSNSGLFSVFSNTDIDKFGKQIPTLGAGVKGYALAVNGIVGLGSNKLDTATKVLIAICEAASKIPANEGMITLWSNIDYDKFGDGSMTSLGIGVANFADEVKNITGISDEKLRTASDVLLAICTAASRIPANSGLKTIFEGINYEDFANDMTYLGRGLVNFVVAVAGLETLDTHKSRNPGKEVDEYTEEQLEGLNTVVRLLEAVNGIVDLLVGVHTYQFKTKDVANIKDEALQMSKDLIEIFSIFYSAFIPSDTGIDGTLVEESATKTNSVFSKTAVTMKKSSGNIYKDLGSLKNSLSTTLSNFDKYFPMYQSMFDTLGSFIQKASNESFDPTKFGTMFTEIVTGLKSILTFDQDIPWTNKHTQILDRVATICESIGALDVFLTNYITSDVTSEKPMSMWFNDLVTAYSGFITGINNFLVTEKALSLDTDDIKKKQDSVIATILSITGMLSSLSPYIGKYNTGELQTWFTDLVNAYASFVYAINDVNADDNLNWTTDGHQAVLDRIEQIIGIIQELDGIEPTISPVLSFDTIEQQLQAWGSKSLTGYKIGLNNTITMQLDSSQFEQLASKDYSLQLTNLATEVTTLREKLVSVDSKLNSFRVVMDTNAMVGALGPGMNLYLGRDSFEAGRGIYNGALAGAGR